jgi:hypothetical protein
MSTFPLELTFNPVLFWDRILQRANDHFSHRQATEQSYLVITDWHHDGAVALVLEFMSLATGRRPELLEECAPCTISFAEWNVTKLLATESGPVTDLIPKTCQSLFKDPLRNCYPRHGDWVATRYQRCSFMEEVLLKRKVAAAEGMELYVLFLLLIIPHHPPLYISALSPLLFHFYDHGSFVV